MARTEAQRRRLTLVATILGSSLAFIDVTVVIIALPTIEQDLDLGLAGEQWVYLSYSLALASLYLVAAVFVGLVAYEALFYMESRSQIRHGALATEDLMAGPRRVREARRQSRRAARQGPT